jgi:Cu2+-exporting ATPase
MRLARDGVLVTRGDALERLAEIDTVVMDKTGTLTTGRPCISKLTLMSGMTEADALATAAAMERDSSHPVASAFAPYARSTLSAEGVEETAGQGLAGTIKGQRWKLGRRDFVTASAAEEPAEQSIYLGSKYGLVASFQLSEELRPQAAETVRALKAQGIHPVLASGDRRDAVESTANALGIGDRCFRLSAEQKLGVVRVLLEKGRRVLMIGDGVNDGPVLAAANVSCAMSEGSAIAHAAADLMLMSSSLAAVAKSVATARRMRSTIRGNLLWALGYNLIAIPLAALDMVPPWLAALGMSASSLTVVLNARRLTKERTS